jgi:hypothetical protein
MNNPLHESITIFQLVSRVENLLAKWLLPWAAWLLARGRFSKRRSLWLDKLIRTAEA